MKTFASLALLVAPALAAADSSFTTLDRADETNQVGLSSSVQFYPKSSVDAVGVREEIFGSYYQNGIGAYAQIPFAHVFSDGLGNPTGIGNLELGGFHVVHAAPGFRISLHAGVVLPTASSSLDGIIANASAQSERITDMVDILPKSTWLRLGASFRGDGRAVFYQGDAGVDLPVMVDDGVHANAALRLNAAAGLHAGAVDLTAEAAFVQGLGSSSGGSDHAQTVAFSVRLPRAKITPSLSYVMPFDTDAGILAHVVSLGITASY